MEATRLKNDRVRVLPSMQWQNTGTFVVHERLGFAESGDNYQRKRCFAFNTLCHTPRAVSLRIQGLLVFNQSLTLLVRFSPGVLPAYMFDVLMV